jgi:hypothetical protein
LLGHLQVAGHRVEVERFADEVAQRDDEFMRVDGAAFDEFVRGGGGEAHLLLGAEQDDVRQRRFDRIAHAPRAVAAAGQFDAGVGAGFGVAFAQVAQMRRIDGQVARERAAERLVRGDQRAQAFVDLPVFALAALLDRLHRNEADADAEQRDDGETDQRRKQGVPVAEVEVAHAGLPRIRRTLYRGVGRSRMRDAARRANARPDSRGSKKRRNRRTEGAAGSFDHRAVGEIRRGDSTWAGYAALASVSGAEVRIR